MRRSFVNSLKEALVKLAGFDADFSDAAREEVEEAGYDTDAEYFAQKAVDEGKGDVDILNRYLDYWFSEDSYYESHEVEYFTDFEGRITAIAVAAG